MSEYRAILEQTRERFTAPELPLEGILRIRDRRRRNQRLAAGAVGLAIALAGILVGTSVIRSSEEVPAHPSPSYSVSIRGCVPACLHGIIEPGDLPKGEYRTVWFFGGEMRLTFERGWTSTQDSSGEFRASPLYAPDENDILFWEDVYPVENGERVKGVPRTAAGLLDWLTSSTQLEVSAPTPGAIGAFPATVVDIRLAPDAVNDDPNCPSRVCANFMGFPQWDGTFGIAGRQVQRFYLSDVTYGGRDHLFVAVIYPQKPTDMKALRVAGERLIATVRVPADPA
jgi:hypothetical protein